MVESPTNPMQRVCDLEVYRRLQEARRVAGGGQHAHVALLQKPLALVRISWYTAPEIHLRSF